MISEPELVGGPGPGEPADVVSGFDPEQRPAADGRRRGRGPLWAAAGALTASGVWAAAVFGYGIGGDGRPDPRGYRVESGSCAAMKLRSLTEAVGQLDARPRTELDGIEHPALRRIRCTVEFEPSELPKPDGGGSGWSVVYQASLTAELHRVTDPRPEFEASATLTEIDGSGVERVERVPDLGDLAHLLVMEDSTVRLHVLEGGAVVKLALNAYMFPEGDGDGEEGLPEGVEEPEALPYRAALIRDMREVIKNLKAD